VNKTIAAIQPSVSLAITSKAKAMAAEGRSVCSFAAGEPDFDTPEAIKAAAAAALGRGETKYAPAPGLPALRSAIAEKLEKENGLTYDPSQIVVSDGAKHSLFNIFMTICSPGDEVIIPAPYWLSYPEMVRIAGGTPISVFCGADSGYKLTPAQLEAALTDRTRALVLNSPCNPTGSVYSGEELRALAELAAERGAYIVSDEIYEKLVYDGAVHVSVGSLSDAVFERTITVNGFSKAAAMTGWRLGYMAAPPDVAKAASALQSHSTSGAVTFAQYGALEALTNGIPGLDDMVAAFAERRARIVARLTAIEGIECVKPQGAFYAFPSIEALGIGSVEFAERLLEEKAVAGVPGKAFDADGNIRLSYACSLETIEEGMDRLEEFVGAL